VDTESPAREEWKEQVRNELHRAEAARRSGNEGQARVCARRAAGHIAGEYLRRQGLSGVPGSAFTRLQALQALGEASPAVREVAGHFLARITPEHELPVDADLIAEARWLAEELLGEII
jgi:hypothetical protein